MSDTLPENFFGRETDRIENRLGFAVSVQTRRGEPGVTAEVNPNLPILVAFHHGHQNVAQAPSTVDITGTPAAPLRVPHVAKQE